VKVILLDFGLVGKFVAQCGLGGIYKYSSTRSRQTTRTRLGGGGIKATLRKGQISL